MPDATTRKTGPTLPPLPLEEWEDTKATLHLYLQIVGKVRLALMPKRNHWWHVPLYVDTRGLTTRPIPVGTDAFDVQFDFIGHALRVTTTTDERRTFPLEDGLTVASFYEQLFGALDDLGIDAEIRAVPFDHPSSTTPFAEDTEHDRYDPAYVHRFWHLLVWINGVLQAFSGRFLGKATPVHLFWHSFDLAYTRFSGRPGPEILDADPVTREAYSHEVVSFGFWAGDQKVRFPAFYSYTYPEPEGLTQAALRPEGARWEERDGGALALLPYEDVRAAPDPRTALLSFLESTYQAGAERAGWDVEALSDG